MKKTSDCGYRDVRQNEMIVRKYIAALLLFASCSVANHSPATDKNETVDSLRTPGSYSYLSDLTLTEVVKLMETDSIRPSDNQVTFAILDSLSSKKKSTRDTCYPAFEIIVDASDGALSEAIGMYIQRYLLKYPSEFFERYKSCQPKTKCEAVFTDIIHFLGYEMGMSPQPDEELAAMLQAIEKVPESNHKQLFINLLKEIVDENN